MKACLGCRGTFPLEEFPRHRNMADGYINKCKVCTSTEARLNRLKHSERYKDYDRRRANLPHRVAARKARYASEIGRLDRALNCRASIERYPEKMSARYRVNNAIRDGRLLRQGCEKCGAKAEAHHENYDRQLEVRWLCSRHHHEIHREKKA